MKCASESATPMLALKNKNNTNSSFSQQSNNFVGGLNSANMRQMKSEVVGNDDLRKMGVAFT